MSSQQQELQPPKSLEELAERAFAEHEPPRDESGKFVAQETVAEPEATPAPVAAPETTPAAPAKREIRYKVDHQERVVDLDAEYADEARRQALAEKIRKGEAFDDVTARERTRGQREVLDILKERGYNIVQNASTGEYEVVAPTAPAPIQDQKANVPPPDIDALEARALEGDAEAIVQLNRITRAEASQVKAEAEARFKAERERLAAQQQANEQQAHFRRAAVAIDEGISALGIGDDPHAASMKEYLRQTAAQQIILGSKIEDAISQMRHAGTIFAGARQAVLSATPTPRAGGSPPPVVPTASGAASASAKSTKPKTLDDLRAQFFG